MGAASRNGIACSPDRANDLACPLHSPADRRRWSDERFRSARTIEAAAKRRVAARPSGVHHCADLCPAAHRTRLRPSEGGTPMRRREILALLSGAALSWPAAALSQQGMPVIAFLHSGLPQVNSGIVEAF